MGGADLSGGEPSDLQQQQQQHSSGTASRLPRDFGLAPRKISAQTEERGPGACKALACVSLGRVEPEAKLPAKPVKPPIARPLKRGAHKPAFYFSEAAAACEEDNLNLSAEQPAPGALSCCSSTTAGQTRSKFTLTTSSQFSNTSSDAPPPGCDFFSARPAIVSMSSLDAEDASSEGDDQPREDFSDGESPLRILRKMAEGMDWRLRTSEDAKAQQQHPPLAAKSKFRSFFNDVSFLDQIEELEDKLAGAIALGSQIGAGSYGRVFRARNEDSGQFLAVKLIATPAVSAKHRQRLLR